MIWLWIAPGFKRVRDFLFCETSFKNKALKLKKKRFWDTSFKMKIKNEACLQDFLYKSSVEDKKGISVASSKDTWTRHFYGCFKVLHLPRNWAKAYESVTAIENDPCWITIPQHELCNPSTGSASETWDISQISTQKPRLPPNHRKGSINPLECSYPDQKPSQKP